MRIFFSLDEFVERRGRTRHERDRVKSRRTREKGTGKTVETGGTSRLDVFVYEPGILP